MDLLRLIPFLRPKTRKNERIAADLVRLASKYFRASDSEMAHLMRQAIKEALDHPACPDLDLSPELLRKLETYLWQYRAIGNQFAPDALLQVLELFRHETGLNLYELADAKDLLGYCGDFPCLRDALGLVALAWYVKTTA